MIRGALPNDQPAIRAIIRHAFNKADEANLVEQLRADGDVLLELVAGFDAGLTGHVLYSRLRIERDDGALEAAALAPVSVLPAFQRKGLGGALIREGNASCAALGLAAIVVLGHPAYYPRFGFSPELARPLEAPFSGKSFMALELQSGALSQGGKVRYARAFGV
jgi:putative acetyltransferase